jgi:WD40 repeat protein
MCMDFNNEGNLFVVGGNDNIIKLYDDNTKCLIAKLESNDYKNPGHSNRIFAVKFLEENDNIIISGGWDNTLKLFDIREKKFVGSLYGPHICGDSLDIKGNKILTGSWATENQIQLFDLRNYKPLFEYDLSKLKYSEGKSSYLYSCKFSKFGIEKNKNLFGIAGSNENFFGCYDYDNYNINDNDSYNESYNNNNNINNDYIKNVNINNNINKNMNMNMNLRTCMLSRNNFKSFYTIDFSYKEREFAVGSGNGKLYLISYNNL